MENTYWKSFDGKTSKLEELDQQHLSNIWWYQYLLIPNSEGIRTVVMNTLRRQGHKCLDYKPKVEFKAEIRMLEEKGLLKWHTGPNGEVEFGTIRDGDGNVCGSVHRPVKKSVSKPLNVFTHNGMNYDLTKMNNQQLFQLYWDMYYFEPKAYYMDYIVGIYPSVQTSAFYSFYIKPDDPRLAKIAQPDVKVLFSWTTGSRYLQVELTKPPINPSLDIRSYGLSPDEIQKVACHFPKGIPFKPGALYKDEVKAKTPDEAKHPPIQTPSTTYQDFTDAMSKKSPDYQNFLDLSAKQKEGRIERKKQIQETWDAEFGTVFKNGDIIAEHDKAETKDEIAAKLASLRHSAGFDTYVYKKAFEGTLIYGTPGSGKSGSLDKLKDMFYQRTPPTKQALEAHQQSLEAPLMNDFGPRVGYHGSMDYLRYNLNPEMVVDPFAKIRDVEAYALKGVQVHTPFKDWLMQEEKKENKPSLGVIGKILKLK